MVVTERVEHLPQRTALRGTEEGTAQKLQRRPRVPGAGNCRSPGILLERSEGRWWKQRFLRGSWPPVSAG